jgi:glucan endo-1,3-alpha-glucosidase
VSDTLFATAFLTAPADVTLTTAEGVSKTFPGVAGINNFNVPLTLNGFIQGTITRASAPVLDVKPANFKFTATPPSVNFNAFVAGATAGRAA